MEINRFPKEIYKHQCVSEMSEGADGRQVERMGGGE